jgi:hypothetical protein
MLKLLLKHMQCIVRYSVNTLEIVVGMQIKILGVSG